MIGCSLNVQLKEENVLCTSCTQKVIISKNETYPLWLFRLNHRNH